MNFRKATDELIATVTLEDLATALGVSLQAVRQARAAEGTTAYRSPPKGWEQAIVRIAKKQASRYEKLADKLLTS